MESNVSGKDYKRHSVLSNLLRIEEFEVDGALVLYDGNIQQMGAVVYLPVNAQSKSLKSAKMAGYRLRKS
ncbi:MAG: hypothetical protein FWD27_08445 [Coriobacteriia bacterium]|nr:hypothetical protein [Coriobacteriia bacterium]